MKHPWSTYECQGNCFSACVACQIPYAVHFFFESFYSSNSIGSCLGEHGIQGGEAECVVNPIGSP